ncbi:redoxin domain-containing protein [uncultured Arcticibacterium sp.]|uniref:redoxin domain-containing protein n=1 Tax=uncultured Arcticibacterium sp. TaxID=2173042 RepID=UPI0030FB4DC9
MKNYLYLAAALAFTACTSSTENTEEATEEIAEVAIIDSKTVKTLEIGSQAPDFNLMGVDNKEYTLESFEDADLLAVLFTCNHCPTAQAYEARVKKYVTDYKDKGVQLVAISPNADKAVLFNELGYTDVNDSFEDMQYRAKDQDFNFPYLYDGATQEVTAKYGPIATPHVFLFDKDRKLQYVGRIDDDEHIGKEKVLNLRIATDALLAGNTPDPAVTKTFGCSIKWMEKAKNKAKEIEDWSKEPVSLEKADLAKLKEVMENKGTGNYRLVNVWATWCGPCVAEFQGLTESYKMYRDRNFEFVTVSNDEADNYDNTLKFLKKKLATDTNYILEEGVNKYDMIEAIDPDWQGALPYTVLISPEGKKVYSQMGEIDILELRNEIADNIGRYFD